MAKKISPKDKADGGSKAQTRRGAALSKNKVKSVKRIRASHTKLQTNEEQLAQRNAELAILNSVGEAMAKTLDVKTVAKIVGDKLREIFNVEATEILLLDPQTNLIHVPYSYYRGAIEDTFTFPLGEGLTSQVISSRQPLVLGTLQDQIEHGAIFMEDREDRTESNLMVPIIMGKTVLGAVSIQSYQQHAYNENHVRLLQTLAANMGVAIQNARLFEADQERVAETEMLRAANVALTQTFDLDNILGTLLDHLHQVVPYDSGSVFLLESETLLTARAARGYEQWTKDAAQAIGVSFDVKSLPHIRAVVEDQATVIIPDVTQDPHWMVAPTGMHVRSWLAVPLVAGGKSIGIYSLDKSEPRFFTPRHQHLAESLAAQAAIAIQNATLYRSQNAARAQAETLHAVTQALSRTLSLQEVFELILIELQKVVPYDSCSIQQLDGEYSVIVGGRGFPNLDELLGMRFQTTAPGDLSSYVIKTRRPHIEADVSARFAHFKDIEAAAGLIHGWLGVPLIFGDRLIGMLALDKHEKAFYTPEHAQLALAFAAQAAVAIENARLLETEHAAREQAEAQVLENARLFKAEQERVAELQIINSIQQGLAAELNFQAIVDLVGDKLREVFNSGDMGIRWYDVNADLLHHLYEYEHGLRLTLPPVPPSVSPLWMKVLETHQPIVCNTLAEQAAVGVKVFPGTDQQLSFIQVPIISSDRVLGDIIISNLERENAFGESELRLLTTIAASLGTAVENARLFDETQRLFKAEQERVAELQIINSIQQGLAAELDFQAIVDLVGDKLREVFNAPDLAINWYDEKANLIHSLYNYEHNKRLTISPYPPTKGGSFETMTKTRQPLVMNTAEYLEKTGVTAFPGTDQSKSIVAVPIISSDRMLGSLHLENFERENAFGESELRLLTTIAASLGTALENARLFDETQRLLKITEDRAAELAIINSVQAALAAKLEMQAVYDAVGDKIQAIFDAQAVTIETYDSTAGLVSYRYGIEKGKRFQLEPRPLIGFRKHVIETRQVLLVNQDTVSAATKYGNPIALVGEVPKSFLFVPLLVGNEAKGVISLQNIDRENAFSDSDVSLLTTLANAMSVALENARLFKAEQERVAELQIINSIQQGLAAELNFQAIVDLVGDKLREVFKTPDLHINWHDAKNNLISPLYYFEHGMRHTIAPYPPTKGGLFETMVKTRQPVVWNTRADYKTYTLPGTDPSKSLAAIPIISSDRVLGAIQIENFERENAYGESELRLLTTIAASLGTALENARLFDETQQRNAELAIINSVQAGLASKLDLQAIYDLVGDKIREIFDAQSVMINYADYETQTLHMVYVIENGQRYFPPPRPLRTDTPVASAMLRTRQPVVVNTVQELEAVGVRTVEGTQPTKSAVWAPLFVGDQLRNVISIQSVSRENAFSESDVRLLQTLANSMSVALENARLFDETQRLFKAEQERVAELQIINSIQQGLAAELDFQAIVDLVGDKLSTVLNTRDLGIRWYDEKTNLIHYLYEFEHGKRLNIPPEPPASGGTFEAVLKTHQPIVFNNAADYLNVPLLPGTDPGKSYVSVPIITGDRVIGVIGIENYERENAYGESELRLLTTIAASLGTALENARLFDETQRLFKAEQERVAELQIINSIQQGLAAELDFQAIVDLVGDKLREVFNTPDLGITWYDEKANLVHYLYMYEHGKRLTISPRPPRPGGMLETQVKTRQPIVFNNVADYEKLNTLALPGTDQGKSLASVPIISSDRVLGAIGLENYERENAFGESELRLLTTIAASLGTALENARLFDEVQKRNLEISEALKQQTATSDVLRAMSGFQPDLRSLLEIIAENIAKVCDANDAHIYRLEGQSLKEWTHRGPIPGLEAGESLPLNRDSVIGRAIIDRQIIHIHDAQVELNETEYPVSVALQRRWGYRTVLATPLLRDGEPIGGIAIRRQEMQPFTDKQIELIKTFADQAVIAIENVRLFDETQRLLKDTQQRNAELAIINSVQAALAAELNIQGIYEAVGDKIREIFHNTDMSIRIHDPQTNLLHFPYAYENGQRIVIESFPLSEKGFAAHVIRARETVVVNENMAQALENYGSYLLPGTQAEKSAIFVPLVSGDQVRGLINLLNMEREHAFSDSDVRLLQTLANSMSVALENARLFDETQRLFKAEQERVAELQIINSIQQGLAAELDFQAIVDLVGDKLREVFNAPDLGITWYDEKANLLHYLYNYEHGKRLTISPRTPRSGGVFESLIKTREPVVLNNAEDYARLNFTTLPGTDQSKSAVSIPIISSDRVLGIIGIEDYERENAYGESELRLLTTIAASLGTALENARLFDETQQRNAELAIINSVQASLAAKLEMQAIYDAVGDKIQEIFDAQVVMIVTHDKASDLVQFSYAIEKGERFYMDARPVGGITGYVMRTGKTVMINQNIAQREFEILGAPAIIPAGGDIKSRLDVPMMVGSEVKGAISLQNVDRENAFTESDLRLLTTLANSMSVALENARLFDETQRLLKETEQRNAELAIMNSVQALLASKLEIQAIYDLVGDKIREIFNAQHVVGAYIPPNSKYVDFKYTYSKNGREYDPPAPLGPIEQYWLETREPLVWNSVEQMRALPSEVWRVLTPQGQELPQQKSFVGVGMFAGDELRGGISLQNLDRENAYSDSDVRLLQTLANSMSVALENARLFDETQRLLKETEQRAAELAIINRVQEGLASKLDMQAIFDLVGDKIQSMFNAHSIVISSFDHEKQVSRLEYAFEDGQRFYDDELLPLLSPMNKHLIESRQPVVINANSVEEAEKYGLKIVEGTQTPRSMIFVPFGTGTRVNGNFSLQNTEREYAFAESDVRLLQTLAGSMGIALENARLFDETQRLLQETEQRATELAVINSISQSLASRLDFEPSISLIGEKLGELFGAQYIYIALYNQTTNRITFPYFWADGQLIEDDTEFEFGEGVTSYVLRTRQPLLIKSDAARQLGELGAVIVSYSQSLKSSLIVPILAGEQAIGTIALQSSEDENLFTESDVRLLTTIASNIGVSLQNARLFNETQRLLKETEDRAQELAIINSVGEAMSRQLDMQTIARTVGDKVTEIFSADAASILLLDQESSMILPVYEWDAGAYIENIKPFPLGTGLTSRVIQSRQPLVLGTAESAAALEAYYPPEAAEINPRRTESYLGVPIIVGEKVIGVISAHTYAQNAYDSNSVRLLSTLANNMGVALENARLFDETERLLKVTEDRAQELSAISTVSQALVAESELDNMIQLIGSQMREIFKADIAYLALLDPQTNLIRFPYQHGESFTTLNLGEGLTSKIIQSGEPLLINRDIQERRAQLGATLVGRESLSYLGVPIKSGRESIGVLSVQSITEEGVFDDDDLRLLTTIAANAGAAIHTAQLHSETQRSAREMATLAEVGRDISSSLEASTVLEGIAKHAKELLNGNLSALFIPEGDGTIFRAITAVGEEAEQVRNDTIKMGEGLLGDLARRRAGEIVNDTNSDPRTILIQGTKAMPDEHLLAVPLLANDELKGLMAVWRTGEGKEFIEAELEFLNNLARQAVIAIQNTQLFEEAQRLLKETEQRAAELQIINSVQEGLASKLDVQAIYDLVGDKIRDIFHAQGTAIYLFDHDRECQDTPYCFLKKRFTIETHPFSQVSNLMIDTPQPRIYRSVEEYRALGGTILENQDEYKSGMYVPLMVGKEIKGMIGIANLDQENSYSESDLRLLTTLANSMSVALENARLFDETQRLFKEATEARAAAEQANKAKSTFLANMSHELRTPLNAIIGFTRIVRKKADGALPEKQLQNLDKVLTSSEHLLGLINTVLDIAKIEAGRMDVIASNFSISMLMDQCANLATPLLKPQVKLEKSVDPNASIIYSDQDKIKQIVLNLLSNAAKFTHDGKIVLALQKHDDILDISVTDSGIGISEDALGRIFEEFQQADTSTTRQYGGTGLGLAISRNLARLLGGELRATSELDKGSTFILTLPIQYGKKPASSDTKPDIVQPTESQSQTDSSKKRILIIDDDPDAAYILQESLNQNEFAVLSAPNGHTGLQMARDGQPDAILLDILMPETDGWQVLNDLKMDAATVDIPVILLTIVDKKALGFKLGAAAYLLKPLDPTVVLEALRRVIGERGHPHKHILVVDDDPHVAEMLRQTLPESEFELTCAEDGEAGLQAIELRRPDIILLDLMMPKLDGFGVIERLRLDPELRNIPIIVISAKELTADESKTLRESVAFVMKKQGFDSELLKEEINSVVKR